MYLENKLKEKYSLNKRVNVNNGFIWSIDNKILKSFQVYNKSELNKVKSTFEYLKKQNNSSIATIYHFDSIFIEEKKSIYFYYIMEKLNKLPNNYEEGKFFQDILNHYCYDYRKIKIPQFLDSKLIFFMENLRKIKYKYTDFHSKNVMLDNLQNYKLIDLESFCINYGG